MSAETKQPRTTTEQAVDAMFDKGIAQHVATVVLDHDLYRHIECRKPGTGTYAFRVVTWPGALCISGDMGSFVFQRIEDMFAFFRSDSGRVNLSYWREKLVAIDRGGANEFNSELFDETISRLLEEHIEGEEYEPEDIKRLRDQLASDVLGQFDNGYQTAYAAAARFEFNDRRVFSDIWKYSFKDYTYQYVWCCRALVWAIAQYDETRNKAEAELEAGAAS